MLVDRTFDTLSAAASGMMGGWAGFGVRYISWYRGSNSEMLLTSTCPKVIAADPGDSVISWAASAAVGLACQSTLQRLSPSERTQYRTAIADISEAARDVSAA